MSKIGSIVRKLPTTLNGYSWRYVKDEKLWYHMDVRYSPTVCLSPRNLLNVSGASFRKIRTFCKKYLRIHIFYKKSDYLCFLCKHFGWIRGHLKSWITDNFGTIFPALLKGSKLFGSLMYILLTISGKVVMYG